MSPVLAADRLVTEAGDWSPGWIAIDDGVVTELGGGDPPVAVSEHLDGIVVPGFVDIHSHGAVGVDFGSADQDGARAILGYHASRGTTRMLASVATAPLDSLDEAVRRLRPLVEDGSLAGIHLEGPYLSPARRGAHDPELLRLPSLDEIRRLVSTGGGAIRMVTIAPELEGAEEVIRWLVEQGITVALGHSDADAATARVAIGWGASVVTHLFNGMRPLHHREAGLAGVALLDDGVTVELILDGHHLRSDIIELVRRMALGRLALISDAMAATGCGDGEYGIAGSSVRVVGGVARLTDGSSLAGSTITVADGFRMLVDTLDSPMTAAVRAATGTPARAVRLTDTGLASGSAADLVVLDGDAVARVMRRGEWLESSS
ncbi:N-acetylglucosamine-6-phosphate deacetylase [Glaciihabitans sp. UYNi722]|uniref:N-acetylglucosamine-6-phosphate deacetylase n=1 Tax=Glaciihabitans sp. UYNi722 TaxID=3156344 RepID=UPI00339888EA